MIDARMTEISRLEQELQALWAEVLGLEQVGIDDEFFVLGGHSLLAARLMMRLRERFRIDLPLQALFIAPTVAGLAREIERARAALAVTRVSVPCPDRAERVDGASEPLSGREADEAPPMIAAGLLEPLRAANAQLHQAIQAGRPVDRYPAGFHPLWYLKKGIRMCVLAEVTLHDVPSLEAIDAAFHALVAAQPLMRALLVGNEDEASFHELEPVPLPRLPVVDLSGERAPTRAALLSQLGESLRSLTAAGPMTGAILFHAALARMAEDQFTVMVCFDHIIADRDCLWIVERQLREALARATPGAIPAHAERAFAAPAPDARPGYKEFAAATLASRTPAKIKAFKRGERFLRYRAAVVPLQERFPVGTSILHSAPVQLLYTPPETPDGEAFMPLEIALHLALVTCRLQFGIDQVPMRVLTSGRRFGRTGYYHVIGDFHDSLPVVFDAEEAALPRCHAVLLEEQKFYAADQTFLSAMGADEQVLRRFFMSPFNFNFVDELSAVEEEKMLATVGPLPFVSYPILAYARAGRAGLLFLHGLEEAAARALEAHLAAMGGQHQLRTLPARASGQ